MKRIGSVGIYGNTFLKRVYCGRCRGTTIVVDGKKNCCLETVSDINYNKIEYISEPRRRRKQPPKKEKAFLKETQKNKCIYCGIEIGGLYKRRSKYIISQPNYDHYVPFSFSFNNKKTNFVLSCNICNAIKSNKMFNTLEEAIKYVEDIRKKKGISNFIPNEEVPTMQQDVPSNENGQEVLLDKVQV